MVIISGKEAKRKRKQMPIEPAIAIETPKRTKVQAQRKFAQGQSNPSHNGGSNASSSAAAIPGGSSSTTTNTGMGNNSTTTTGLGGNSSNSVLITEPIMATPPPAKDFLTYVCFQRNPVFQSLNYLGKPTLANNTIPEASTSSTVTLSPVKSPLKRLSRGEEDSMDGEGGNKPRPGRKTKHVDAKPFVSPPPATTLVASGGGGAVKKGMTTTLTTVPVKRRPGRPPKVDPVMSPPPAPPPVITTTTAIKSESEYETASENGSENGKRAVPPGGGVRGGGDKRAIVSPLREEEEEGKSVKGAAAVEEGEVKEERITRHMAWRHSYNNTPIEPTVKRIKKVPPPSTNTPPLPVVSPPPQDHPVLQTAAIKKQKKKKKKEKPKTKAEEDSEFSSEDDKPLVIGGGKIKGDGRKTKKGSDQYPVEESDGEESLPKRGKPNQQNKKKNRVATTSDKNASKCKSTSPVLVVAANSSASSTPSKQISKATLNKKQQKQKRSTTLESDSQLENSTGAAKRKYRSKEVDKLTGQKESSTPPLSTELTTARPSRKTKEAATIYMELIGNLQDMDEEGDGESMDSYPELPNVKKTQQLEEECRQNRGHNKVVVEERRGRKKKKKEEEKEGLNKSFSDSDEEPLATKVCKKGPVPATSPPSTTSKVAVQLAVLNATPTVLSPSVPEPATVTSTPIEKRNKVEVPKRSPVKLADAEDILNFSMNNHSFKSPVSNNCDQFSMAISTPENLKLNRSAMGQQQQQQQGLLKSPSWQHQHHPNHHQHTITDQFLRPPNKQPPRPTTISPIIDDTSPQGIASLMLMNPLPSKEESGKIFGIASVTLAQSSGPLDTKCTLGKCGSVHNNPSLGPAVPTEALLGETAASKDRRKSKVNMSQEQIQRWLAECAAVKEKEVIPDDLADVDGSVTPQPSTGIVDSPMDEGSPALVMRKQEAPRPPAMVGVSASMGVSQQGQHHQPITKARNLIEKFDEERDAVSCEVEQSVKQIIQKLNFDEEEVVEVTDEKEEKVNNNNNNNNLTKGKRGSNNAAAKNDLLESPTTPTSTVDRKPIYNRRTPVYNKAAVDSPQPPKATLQRQQSFGGGGGHGGGVSAFSPDNEPSVYDFDRDDDEAPGGGGGGASPMKPPFRRGGAVGGRRSKEESPKRGGATTTTSGRGRRPNSISPLKKPSPVVESPGSGGGGKRGRTSGGSNRKASDTLMDNKGNDSEDDSEGQTTIYIPLQNAGGAVVGGKAGNSDQMIQGVAVKLGTDGPDGCVIMKAKLVTKAVGGGGGSGGGGSSISDAKTQELMKSIMAGGKETTGGGGGGGGKPVPIGTVQPRFKSHEPLSTTTTSTSNSSRAPPPSIHPSNNTAFPRLDDPAQMVEAPVFRPTEKEFQDPIEFIERIRPLAARFGLCRIIPPASFKPECRVSDEMRFMAYNQYVHKMLHRWGPSAKELGAIRKYLATQSIQLQQPPLIGGMEVDLPRLYHTVQELGGLSEVIERKKWARVAEEMCIPKTAQERVSKLDDVYCKYLLPYDTLSAAERQKLFDEVEADWAKREAKARRNAMRKIEPSEDGEGEEEEEEKEGDDEEESDEDEDNLMECIVKGRSMALSAFFRVARNTMQLWFKSSEPPPPPAEVESEFWRHVAVRDSHVCVHSGSIDSSGWGYGFPAPGKGQKGAGASPCAKHPWNLKVLTNSAGSVLRSLGPVMGVTVPTLHVGMLFSACCWYRDPHGLPWIEYLHTGASKVWYGVPDEQSGNFRGALTGLVPTHCQNKTIWLPCDTAMVPPHILTEKGVSLCRTEQQPGQFVIIFPRAYTSSVATGYVVSESVYFATNSWLETAHEDFKDIQESREPTMFSLDQLIFAMAADQRCSIETLAQVEPMIKAVLEKERTLRNSIKDFGVVIEHRKKAMAAAAGTSSGVGGKKGSAAVVALPEEEIECDLCRTNLFISMVRTETEDEVAYYCLQHGLMYLKRGELQAQESKLIYNYEVEEIEALTRKLKDRVRMLQHQQQKKGK